MDKATEAQLGKVLGMMFAFQISTLLTVIAFGTVILLEMKKSQRQQTN